MKILLSLSLILTFFGCIAFAQGPPTVADTTPTYIIAGGVGYSPYTAGITGVSGIGIFAVHIAKSNLLSWSTMQMVPGQKTGANVRTGLGYIVYQGGPWSLTAIADAGVAMGGAVTLGTFSGGGVLAYEFKPKLYFTVGLSIVQVSSNLVQPSFGFGFAKGL